MNESKPIPRVEQVEAGAIEAALSAPAPAPAAPAGTQDPRFAIQINGYITEYIKLADTKAGVLIVFLTALLALFERLGVFGRLGSLSTWATLRGTILPLTLLAVLAGIILGVFVVLPRTARRPATGFIFWESVAEWGNAERYVAEALRLTDEDFKAKLFEQNFYLAQTATAKYTILKWALLLGVGGGLLGFLQIIVGSQ